MNKNLVLISLDEQYFDETLKLIEDCFQYKDENSFKNDFSFLFTDENLKNNKIIFDKTNNKVIGHFGICKRNLIFNEINTPIAFMGGICIDKEYRGKGLFDYFFKIILNQLEKKFTMTVLWSGDPEIYYKYSFHLAIEQHSYQFENIEDSEYKKINELDETLKSSIKQLYNNYITKRFITPQRNDNHWQSLWNMNKKDIYIQSHDGQIVSYFIVNKGQDLENIIHEIAIDNIDHFIPPNKEFILWYPTEVPSDSHQTQFGAIIRLNSNTFTEKFFSELTSNSLLIRDVDNKDNLIRFLFNGDKNEISMNDFLTGFFGPGKFEEFNKFPTKLYIPGIDSI